MSVMSRYLVENRKDTNRIEKDVASISSLEYEIQDMISGVQDKSNLIPILSKLISDMKKAKSSISNLDNTGEDSYMMMKVKGSLKILNAMDTEDEFNTAIENMISDKQDKFDRIKDMVGKSKNNNQRFRYHKEWISLMRSMKFGGKNWNTILMKADKISNKEMALGI